MATTEKAPTRKQLAARAKFARMVKARAKAAATAKRAAGYRKVKGMWVAPKTQNPKGQKHGFWVSGQSAKRSKTITKYVKAKSKKHAISKTSRKIGGFKTSTLQARPAPWHSESFTGTAVGKSIRRHKRKVAKRGNPLSVIKNGRRLYGAAAAAVLAKRAGGKKRATTKRNGIFTRTAKAAISKRLTQPIRFRRKRNSSTPAAINDVHKMFLGRPSTKSFSVKAPSNTPADVAVLGPLVCLKTRDEEFAFSKGEAWIATDGKAQKLYILGDKYAGGIEPNSNFGHITEIRYEARKDHINPFKWKRRRRNAQVTEYFHHFGEVTGVRPRLQSDKERLLHIVGGQYSIKSEGIVN